MPLGVLLLTALGWALFERKRRYAMINSAAAVGAAAVPGASYPVQMQQPVYGNGQMADYPAPGMEGLRTQELDGEIGRAHV